MLGDGPENKELELIIRRRVLNNSDLFSKCPFKDRRKSSLYSWARSRIERFNFGKCLRSTFPLYSILSTNYDKRLLLHDIIAGLTVSSLHVPQGMAYGQLAGLKPINGIYTSFFPALIYIMFGASRHISIGTFSVMSLLVAEPVDRLSESFKPCNQTNKKGYLSLDDYRLEVAITVTVLVGIMQFLMGLFHLGLLVVYISPAILGGFTCGAAVHVLSSQLNGLFGFRLRRFVGPGRLLFEMSALGLANIFGGFFQCHACSGGLARTSVAVGAGMQSQVSFNFFYKAKL
ncbi:Solute carrier family 26 [Fasciolopsis buskii]|uniref:Solute carrier family 26 n=1 Tax=Fasciolopsis buskii TaxID=27845 RepID=A0A8E0RLG9_9TREM|nr:Solute carrier family 26 [Fasciolopsis buski]